MFLAQYRQLSLPVRMGECRTQEVHLVFRSGPARAWEKEEGEEKRGFRVGGGREMSTSRLIMAQRRTNKGERKTFSPGPCFRGRRGISDGEEETSHTEVLYFFFSEPFFAKPWSVKRFFFRPFLSAARPITELLPNTRQRGPFLLLLLSSFSISQPPHQGRTAPEKKEGAGEKGFFCVYNIG